MPTAEARRVNKRSRATISSRERSMLLFHVARQFFKLVSTSRENMVKRQRTISQSSSGGGFIVRWRYHALGLLRYLAKSSTDLPQAWKASSLRAYRLLIPQFHFSSPPVCFTLVSSYFLFIRHKYKHMVDHKIIDFNHQLTRLMLIV